MLTVETLKRLVNENLLQSLKPNNGITTFLHLGRYAIGISYETGNAGNPAYEKKRYIFNLFSGDEYININYYKSNKGLNDKVFQEVVDTWNNLVDVRKIVVDEIMEKASNLEKEEIIGEQLTGELVEVLDERIADALYELTEDGFAQVIMKYLKMEDIGSILMLGL